MSEWDEFIHKGKLVEEAFAKQHLQDVVWSNNQQNIQEKTSQHEWRSV